MDDTSVLDRRGPAPSRPTDVLAATVPEEVAP